MQITNEAVAYAFEVWWDLHYPMQPLKGSPTTGYRPKLAETCYQSFRDGARCSEEMHRKRKASGKRTPSGIFTSDASRGMNNENV